MAWTALTRSGQTRLRKAWPHHLRSVRRRAFDHLTPEEQADLTKQTAEAVTLLRKAVGAQGFNIGINLGRVAGAGVPGHLHQHVVPRWAGDVNFMGVVGEVQVVPQAMCQLWEELDRLRTA